MNFEERQSLRNRKVNAYTSLPVTLWDVVDRFADSRGMGQSDAVAHLIRQGLRREAEDSAKAK